MIIPSTFGLITERYDPTVAREIILYNYNYKHEPLGQAFYNSDEALKVLWDKIFDSTKRRKLS